MVKKKINNKRKKVSCFSRINIVRVKLKNNNIIDPKKILKANKSYLIDVLKKLNVLKIEANVYKSIFNTKQKVEQIKNFNEELKMICVTSNAKIKISNKYKNSKVDSKILKNHCMILLNNNNFSIKNLTFMYNDVCNSNYSFQTIIKSIKAFGFRYSFSSCINYKSLLIRNIFHKLIFIK